jgi:hypothetical protein
MPAERRGPAVRQCLLPRTSRYLPTRSLGTTGREPMMDDQRTANDDPSPRTPGRLGELTVAFALMTLEKADKDGYKAASQPQRLEDAEDLARVSVDTFKSELTALGEGEDATAFCAEVLRGAIRAVALITTCPEAAENMLRRLRIPTRGKSQLTERTPYDRAEVVRRRP